jgi:hypothetical protein
MGTRLVLCLLLLASAFVQTDVAAQTIWRCGELPSEEIYTDRPAGQQNCQVYQSHTPSVMVPTRRDAEVKLTVPATPIAEATGASDRRAEDRGQDAISFSALNRLAVGMTEAEVMNIAGAPRAKNLGSWVYRAGDDSMVELRFGSGRVVEIRQYQASLGK